MELDCSCAVFAPKLGVNGVQAFVQLLHPKTHLHAATAVLWHAFADDRRFRDDPAVMYKRRNHRVWISLRYTDFYASPRRRSRWTQFQSSFFAANAVRTFAAQTDTSL
jgi:hypothetical protein